MFENDYVKFINKRPIHIGNSMLVHKNTPDNYLRVTQTTPDMWVGFDKG